MSEIETYVERARRLELDPTQVCIACGVDSVQIKVSGKYRFCPRDNDWEVGRSILCRDCGHELELTCSKGVRYNFTAEGMRYAEAAVRRLGYPKDAGAANELA